MTDKSFTDAAYEKMEEIEQKRKRLPLIMVICLAFASLGLGADAVFYMISTHQKGDLSDINLTLIGIFALIFTSLLIIGLNRYVLLKKWENQIHQMELLEETICSDIAKRDSPAR